VPAAPPLFSTITGCPHFCVSLVAMMRVPVSVPPPGGNGTTMVTERAGQACANASGERRSEAASVAAVRSTGFMWASSADHAGPLVVELPAGDEELHRLGIVARAQAMLLVE